MFLSIEIAVWGTGLNRSNLETTPDPASYWSLNEICKYKGEGMKLLMFDTGITITLASHPSFTNREIKKKRHFFACNCNDLDGHGTFCAGIACGNETFYRRNVADRSQVNFRGVAPCANLVIWKGYDYVEGIRPAGTWLPELEKMASECVGVDVVVISSGFDQPSKRMEDAIMELHSKGVIVVCAAGNDGARDIHNIKYPARYPQTICVGAHDRDGNRCGFSSVGEEVDVLALGGNIIGPKHVDTNLEDSNIGKYMMHNSGTSFAAAAVGALICLILQAVKDTCSRQHYDRIKGTESMKKLLQELSTKKHVISREQLDKFFNNHSLVYPGPELFINELITSGKI